MQDIVRLWWYVYLHSYYTGSWSVLCQQRYIRINTTPNGIGCLLYLYPPAMSALPPQKGPTTIEAMIKGPHGFAAKAKDALVELIG